ncbi:putative proton-dependent oligopeptide transporter family, MFS transporter superfamily [Helianthus annuus]|nr:protein NRT1/ PTR FAMILY 1.2 [Helianthus annuus]KAJ0581650.1 putative proton-dependent oligopeptide transporter family, MFS transporter superfamily [Helianthus annuus]KAJ0597618.1 putative proton-dependent oligopeptide transporter family, MFS transporter superfamily [Helianthus annuus]KAJ0758262.1 putative proton-dependent oligopeptide transporter family, MFS transporter superfamily [Helianthus annuus]KAJ0927599.1 putative proton-dependent oligopeptide transporter family, MFS transporter sup
MKGDSNQEESIVETELQTELLVHNHHDLKGGMITMPFIIVNEAFERVASYGLMPNMIFYLMDVYHMELATGTSILSIWSALSNGLSIFGAFISDSYFGRFRVIAFGSLSTLLGMTFLWLTSVVPQLTPSSCNEPETGCNPTTPTQLAFLFSCFILLSIGSGCIRPCSIAFGADQLKHHPTPNNQRLIDSYFNWYYVSIMISTVVAFTAMVYIQEQLGWQVGFAVAVLIMFCSALMFLLGSSLYVKVKPSESLFLGLVQVLVVAFKNRGIELLPDDCYNHSKELDHAELTDNLRFFNKACVLKDLNIDSSGLDPWSVSNVEKVESLKSLIRVLPLWSTGILLFTTISQNFPTLQVKTMNRYVTSWFEIPAASFTIFMVLTLTIWIAFYDCILVPFIAKYTHEPRGFHPKTRMGIGLVISTGGMMVSAIVETKRRDFAGSNTTTVMSAMWLVPQYALLGLAEALNSIGQIEFYYSELPKGMSSIAIAMFLVSNAISGLFGSLLIKVVDTITTKGGNISWLSSDINKGHLDYYYWLLCFLNLLNFFYYLVCYHVHRSSSS